jgi:hypothetical protein
MKVFRVLPALLATVILPAAISAAKTPTSCKPITFWGVSGCEVLPNGKCPARHHVQVVGPQSPQMKAARLICVPDKAAPKKSRAKPRPKPSPE